MRAGPAGPRAESAREPQAEAGDQRTQMPGRVAHDDATGRSGRQRRSAARRPPRRRRARGHDDHHGLDQRQSGATTMRRTGRRRHRARRSPCAGEVARGAPRRPAHARATRARCRGSELRQIGVAQRVRARRSAARAPRRRGGSAAMSAVKRCRRASSKATIATSHGRVGGSAADRCGRRADVDPCGAELDRASTGMVLTIPRRGSARRRSRAAGTGPDGGARQHGVDERPVDEPVLGRRARSRGDALERHRQVLDPPRRSRPCSSASSGSTSCRCVRVRASVPTRRSAEPPSTPASASDAPQALQLVDGVELGPLGHDRAVHRADGGAQHRSGRTPCSSSARSMPTSAAPRTPPPPSTKATLTRGRRAPPRATGGSRTRA